MGCRAACLLLAVPTFLLFSLAGAQEPPIPGAPPFFVEPPFFGAPPSDGRSMPQNVSCKDIGCGRGICNSSYSSYRNSSGYGYSYSYNYSTTGNGSLCGCRKGWSAAFSNGDFWYRPCVVPICNTSRSCNNYTLPEIPRTPPANYSDPCAWAYCGAGKCVTTSAYRYRCDCNTGFHNLFNDSTYPCYNECLISTDECKSVGATIANATAESPGGDSPGSPGGNDGGESMIPVKVVSLIAVLMCLALN